MERSKSSLLYWYPKIKDLGIPTPKTEIINLTKREIDGYHNCKCDCFNLSRLEKEVKRVVKSQFKLPVFLRTDEFSNKYFWKKSCYLDDLGNIKNNLFEIISGSRLTDIIGSVPIGAIVVREFIPMDTRFTAFSREMPINPERRYFIGDGKVECHHPYWIEDVIERGTPKEKLPKNWKELVRKMNFEYKDEIDLLSGYSIIITNKIKGYWSVDFCKSKKRDWYLIDMAEGEKSWHPSSCKYSNMPEEKPVEKPDFDSMIIKTND